MSQQSFSPNNKMNPILSHVVAVTGTIGSGKSTVVKLLGKQGAFIVSADELAREVVKPGTEGIRDVVAAFGREVLDKDGALDREKMADLVFTDPAKKKMLEGILHPLIAKQAEEVFKAAIARGVSPIIYEVPLLFEAGLNKAGFRKIIVVTASDEVCIKRITERDSLSEDKAAARLRTQIPTEVKRKGADIVIDNSGSIEQLEKVVTQIFTTL